MTSHRKTIQTLLSGLLLATGLLACQPRTDASEASGEPTAQAAGGGGLVILPYEDPLIGPTAEIDPRLYYHDFGRVPEGQKVTRVFRLENTDPGPLTIKRLVPSCGCTLPSIHYVEDDGEVVVGRIRPEGGESVITIPAGVVADLALEIDTSMIKNANVDKLLTATITTDSPNGYYLNVEAHIFVERPFTVVPEVLNLGRLPINAGGQKSVQVVQSKGFSRRVTEILEVPDGIRAELSHDTSLGQSVWILNAVFEPPLELGRRTETLLLATETEAGEPSEPVKVPITAEGVPDLLADPARLVFATERTTATTGAGSLRSLLSGHRYAIQEARLPAEHAELLELSYEAVQPDADGRSAAWSLVLTTKPPLGEGELLAGEVELVLDDPQHPSVRVPYVVHLR